MSENNHHKYEALTLWDRIVGRHKRTNRIPLKAQKLAEISAHLRRDIGMDL